jgi:demethylspheroidene O-methyltransferase
MSGTPGAEPVGNAYFGFYLLAMGRGRPRTPGDLRQMLLTAGFSSAQLLHTHQPLQTRLIVARKTPSVLKPAKTARIRSESKPG